MKACIISIGDELLIGKTINTNAAFIGEKLELLGIQVDEILTISDDRASIHSALSRGFANADILIMTGGLGPTRDDITKNVLADFFGTELRMDERQLQRIKKYFESRGRQINELNEGVAYIPANAKPIDNEKGTAAGMWIEEAGRILVSMPGVLNEMRAMLTEQVLPKLRTELSLPVIIHRHLHTAGIGESMLSGMLDDLESALPEHIRLAYLPNIGQVKLRLTARGTHKDELLAEIDHWTEAFIPRLGKYFFGRDEISLPEALGKLLMEENDTVGTAESCTGGNIAHLLTSVAGSSAYFQGSVVCYANAVKMNQLGVPEDVLIKHGAVSEPTIRQMVSGLINLLSVDYAMATSGIAGPGGGSKEKPVGTVWIGVGNKEQVHAREFHFPLGRLEHIEFTSITAMEMLRRFILRQRGQLD
jgi:nicotinamide-nucleotide amidase